MKRIVKRVCNISFFLLPILLLCIYTFRFTTIFDEDYSLMLIHHSIKHLITLDSLDVHPPLYYFILKLFLSIFTFWTSSFFLKVIFARVLSIIISLVSFYYLIRIANLLNIRIKIINQWILFLIVPGVISFTYEFIKIRMYSLGAFFVILELYSLLLYSKKSCNKFIILAVISSVLSFYTNYYSAFISGIILIEWMFIYFIHHNRKWINILFSGLCVIISFCPWIPILFKQLNLQDNHPQGGFVKQWIATFILILIFIVPLLISYKKCKSKISNFYLFIFITTIILFIFMSIVSIFDQSVFQFRYFYPIFIIYGFLGNDILFLVIKKSKCYRIISIIYILLLGLSCVSAYIDQLQYYNGSSINLVKQCKKWKTTNKKNIYLKKVDNVDQGFDIEKSICLSEMNKNIYLPKNASFIKTNPSYIGVFRNVDKHITIK